MIQSMRDNPRGSVEVDWKYEVKGDHFGNWQMIRGGMIRSPGHRYRFRLGGWAKSSLRSCLWPVSWMGWVSVEAYRQ